MKLNASHADILSLVAACGLAWIVRVLVFQGKTFPSFFEGSWEGTPATTILVSVAGQHLLLAELLPVFDAGPKKVSRWVSIGP